MKRIFTLLVLALFATQSFAATAPVRPVLKASEVLITIDKKGNAISLYNLAYISAHEFETISGRKMNLPGRIGFKLSQRELKKSIAEDGTINNKRLQRSVAKIAGGEYGFHFGGFALGFFLGIIGVLIAYLINDDYKQNRVKWAWIAWGIWVAAILVLRIALLAA